MTESYLNLKKRCDELIKENTRLKLEMQENFMIQSMNDMKTMYEEKETQLSDYQKRYDKMRDINYHLTENIRTLNIMLSTLRKELKNSIFTESDVNNYKLDIKLEFLEEIIFNCLKIKNEIMYSDL